MWESTSDQRPGEGRPYLSEISHIEPKSCNAALESVTMHVFLQMHFGLNTQDSALLQIAYSQLGIYRTLNRLYEQQKISAVFFEGWKKDYKAQETELTPEKIEELRKQKEHLEKANDRRLIRYIIGRGTSRNIEASQMIAMVHYFTKDFLVTGWEEESFTDEKIREMVEARKQGDEERETFYAKMKERTRAAYENSTLGALRWFEENPKYHKGYGVVIGSRHSTTASVTGSIESDFSAMMQHPRVIIYRQQNNVSTQ